VNSGQFILLIVILAAILAFVGLPWWMARRREERGWDSTKAYLRVIDALIRGDRPSAVSPLREIAQQDAENLGAYLRLGDLVRKMGHPERALRIHADLLARDTTDPEPLRRVHESYLLDLLELNRPEEGKRHAEKLLALDRKSRIAIRALVRYHEHRGDWERALEYLDQWDQLDPGKTVPTPAQMRIQMARVHLDAGRLREAQKLLEEASQMRPDGPVARVFLGDLFAQEGEMEKACEQWVQHVRDYGYRAEQVFARLEKAYFEMGRFGDLVQVYEQLAAGRSGNLHAAVALADMHRRRGRLDEAIRQLEAVLEADPGHHHARRQLVGNLLQIGRGEQALRELDIVLAQTSSGATEGVCVGCGEARPDLWVRCEGCGTWQTPAAAEPPPRPRAVRIPSAD
jgi:lipopolysaccharide biosynthesis regulator YciM